MPNQLSRKTLTFLIAAVLLSLVATSCNVIPTTNNTGATDTAAPTSTASLTIPEKVLSNKFGFLGGGSDDTGEQILASGAAWARPHPGAFVWDMMQKTAGGEISFTDADREVKNLENFGLLATLWPFANWDQQNRSDANSCKISSNDEFLPQNDKKGRGAYLPEMRCNPNDWTAYGAWVTAIVERYDGDGLGDMPGLKTPVKYWEVMNEPDLAWQPGPGDDRLNFYKQGPAEYGQLLTRTYQAIKEADPSARVLIAGAAGGDERSLSFYRELFAQTPGMEKYFDLGNVHCISNDERTKDFNVGSYRKMLTSAGIAKPVWVTEAEAMYSQTAEQNFQATKTSTAGAIGAGAERIFYTRDSFDDFRTDMSQKTPPGNYPSQEKYREIFDSYAK